MNIQQIIDSAVKEYHELWKTHPLKTDMDDFIISSIKKAVEEAYEAIEVKKIDDDDKYKHQDFCGSRKEYLCDCDVRRYNEALSLIEKKKSLFLHECCNGECNHDDCCGKVLANCPLKDNK